MPFLRALAFEANTCARAKTQTQEESVRYSESCAESVTVFHQSQASGRTSDKTKLATLLNSSSYFAVLHLTCLCTLWLCSEAVVVISTDWYRQ